MSHITSALSTGRAVTVARLSAAMRKNWAEARSADRQLMALRTNLSRHSG